MVDEPHDEQQLLIEQDLLDGLVEYNKRALNAFKQCSIKTPKDLLEISSWARLFKTCGKKTLFEILLGTLIFFRTELEDQYVEKTISLERALQERKNITDEEDRKREVEWMKIMAKKEAIKEAYREEANNEITILKKKAAKFDALIKLAQEM